MAGRPQKPVGQLQNKRNPRGKAGGVTLVADATRKVPAPPRGLTDEARRIWRDFFRSPLGGAVDYQGDGPALRRWITLVSDRERLWSRFHAGEDDDSAEPESLTVFGSQGQRVINPLLRLEERLSREIMAYEDRFGMTPLARMRLGIAIGQAAESLDGLRRRLVSAPADEPPAQGGVIDLDDLG